MHHNLPISTDNLHRPGGGARSSSERPSRAPISSWSPRGTRGIGKTRLHCRPRPTCWTIFRTASGSSTSPRSGKRDLYGTVVRSLGVREEAGKDGRGGVARLAGRELLLLLDNCEQIVEEVRRGRGRDLRSRSHFVRALPAGLADSWRKATDAGGAARSARIGAIVALSEFQEIASVRLFADRAKASWQSFAVQEQNADDIAAICRLVDGIPLALELAAARVNVHSPQELRERLGQRLPTL